MLKAVHFSRFGGPEVLEIVDLPDPHPGPGQVRIAVRAAGVSPSDWKKRKGLMDGGLPQTMGHEAAERAAQAVAETMGWDGKRVEREAQQYRAYLERLYRVRPDRNAPPVRPKQ